MNRSARYGRVRASAIVLLFSCPIPLAAEPAKGAILPAAGGVQAASPLKSAPSEAATAPSEQRRESPAAPAPVSAAALRNEEFQRTVDWVGDASAGSSPRPAAEWGALLPFLGWTAFVLALLGAGAYAARRLLPAARRRMGGDAIQLLVRRSLTPHHTALLVEVGPRLLLLGATKTGLATLAEFRDPEEIARLRTRCPGGREDSEEAVFEDSLRTSLQRYEAAPAAVPAADAPGDGVRLRDAMNEIEAIKKMMADWR